ncbi:MAG TPA: hypothetical protein VH723_06540 [Candidatus Limnocylindrales bacterium]|jgi:hypothetical protein
MHDDELDRPPPLRLRGHLADGDADSLRSALQVARWRLRMATRGGPEWDAAAAAIEELEGKLGITPTEV